MVHKIEYGQIFINDELVLHNLNSDDRISVALFKTTPFKDSSTKGSGLILELIIDLKPPEDNEYFKYEEGLIHFRLLEVLPAAGYRRLLCEYPEQLILENTDPFKTEEEEIINVTYGEILINNKLAIRDLKSTDKIKLELFDTFPDAEDSTDSVLKLEIDLNQPKDGKYTKWEKGLIKITLLGEFHHLDGSPSTFENKGKWEDVLYEYPDHYIVEINE